MCNLYMLRARPQVLRDLLHYLGEPDFPPRSYVSPGSPIAIVRAERDIRHFALVRWGFVPSWAKEVAPGKPLTNARIETVLEEASFRHAVQRRRCLVAADGFYEWSGMPGRKQANHIGRADGRPFAFAGLWEHCLGPDGSEIETAAIITMAAQGPMAEIHERMPVIVPEALHGRWLANEKISPGAALEQASARPDPTLIVEPVQLERTPAPLSAAREEPDQLKLF